GIPASLYFRQRSYNRIFLNLAVMVPLIAITWALLKDDPGTAIDWNDFQTSIMAVDTMVRFNALLKVFTFLAAGRAFVLVTPQEIIQTPIPSFAIFLFFSVINRLSNTPTMAYQPLMLVALLLFCISTLYIISMEETQRWFTIYPPLRVQRRIFWYVLKFLVVLFPVAVVLGFLLQPINLPALAARLYRDQRPPSMNFPGFGGSQVNTSVQDHITMGDIGWPNGKSEVMTVTVSKAKTGAYLWRSTSYSNYENGSWVKQNENESPHKNMKQEKIRTLASDGQGNLDEQWYKPSTEKSNPLVPFLYQGIEEYDPGILAGIEEKKIEIGFGENVASVDLPRDLLAQTIQLKTSVIPGPDEPIHSAALGVLVNGYNIGTFHPNMAQDGSIFMARKKQIGEKMDKYQIFSIVKPQPINMILDNEVSLSDQDKTLNTEMPGKNADPGDPAAQFNRRIHEKALEIIAEKNIKNDDKYEFNVVNAFQVYLSSNYKYTLKPGKAKKNEDPIIDFLFNTKKGYCVYFAGAMTMLCRSVDIPARFAVGFATGEQTAGTDAQANVTTYTVKADDAHAWTEVFLSHYGWYTVDPTAGATPIPTAWESIWGGVVDGLTNAKNFIANIFTNFRTNLRFRIYSIIVIFLLGGIIGLIVYLRSPRPPRLPKEEMTPEKAEQVINACYRCMHRWLDQWGVVKPAGLTAHEFEAHFREINEPMGVLVAEISELYVRTRYAGIAPNDSEARRCVTVLRALALVAKMERRNLYAEADKALNT
ncbi:MAG: transglutaminase domain-containing protein, partial [bacterium]